VSALAIWMYERQIGLLSRQRGVLSFAYTPEALELGAGLPLLSVSMPTRSRRYSGDLPTAFFDGLLPEGEARRMIAYDFGVNDDDVLGLLRAIGRDCAGALVIVPEGTNLDEAGLPEPISDADVAERIRNLRFAPLGVDQRVRASLAGMQEKLLLSRVDDGWGLPVDGAPSTHIMKPAHPLLADSIANEAFCLRLASVLGVSSAPVALLEFDGLGVLAVERYDRTPPDAENRVVRLHQEDLCQAHGLDGQRKYEERGGPSLRQCAALLDRWSSGAVELERLLDITTVNVLVGNADAHAKNLSLIHDATGEVRLAPAYDLMSTVYYPNVSTTAGMFVNGVRDIQEISRDDLVAEAASWGIAEDAASARLEELLGAAAEAIQRGAAEINPPEALVDAVATRAHELAPISVR
jgi:serine/threonine-protein kinase HipA